MSRNIFINYNVVSSIIAKTLDMYCKWLVYHPKKSGIIILLLLMHHFALCQSDSIAPNNLRYQKKQKPDWGILKGLVTEKGTKEEIPFVHIMCSDAAGIQFGITETDIEGKYTLKCFPTGNYILKVTCLGYRTQIINNVKIEANNTSTLNIALEAEKDTSTVIVEYQVPNYTPPKAKSPQDLSASTLKPLDKTDPNYFCEKTFDGIITKEGFKKDGLLNGEIRFYEQGKLINVFIYENDVPNGSYSAYYFPSGKIYITGSFKDGKKEGVFKEYDINGKLISTKKYRDDEQIE